MTIKPVKSEKNESDVPGQHRECLNKISSPKSPVSTGRLDAGCSVIIVFIYLIFVLFFVFGKIPAHTAWY